MKAAYTRWTWIHGDEETAKKQLEQSFKECKFLGYDTVENFALSGTTIRTTPASSSGLQTAAEWSL